MSYLDNKTIGIYIGIAFCPTKCTYCSFPAYLKTGKYNERYNEYFNSLIVEIKEMGKLISETGLKVNTIYIGGGTPSILSNEEIDEMLKCVNENIDMKNIKEFTFEAGRIDTINKEKLETMKKWNIDRISINPQSFNERTLKLVNRYHKREKFDEVFEDAKQLGFIINMDLIIGLPEESTKDVLHTLNELNKYDIENLTIHNLAIKKASKLQKESYEHENNLDYKVIHEKIENVVNAKDLNAYYMYRQKNSFVWGENVGYSKIGLESIYNIEMIYKKREVVKDVSLSMEKGEIVGLLGPNGAGKTTTFYMITGIIQPNHGTVLYNGENITSAPMYERARLGLGYLPQEASVFRNMTVEENILAVLEMRKIPKEERIKITSNLIEEFKLSHVAKNLGYSLSGGERRRVEIARTISTNPDFMLLDEPFAGVDPIAVEDIQNIIIKLKERGLGILITDHNVRETLRITERAYIMAEGSILISGTSDQIANDERARKVYLGDNFKLD